MEPNTAKWKYMVELSGRDHVLIMSFVYSVCFKICNNKAIIILKAKHETE